MIDINSPEYDMCAGCNDAEADLDHAGDQVLCVACMAKVYALVLTEIATLREENRKLRDEESRHRLALANIAGYVHQPADA